MAKYNIDMPKKRKNFLLIVFVSFFILLLGIFLSETLNGFFQKIFSPAEKYIWNSGQKTGSFFYYIFNAKSIFTENQELKKENTELSQKNEELFWLYSENQELRQAIGLSKVENFSLLPSSIISKQAGDDIFIIDKGSNYRVSQGMPVITSQGILIGTIKKANFAFSEVSLITGKDFSFDVSIRLQQATSVQAMALAKGKGNLEISLEYADKTFPISLGDLVFTSAMGGNFPKGLLVGKLLDVQSNPAQLFQTGRINPEFKNSFFSNVFIIQNFQSFASGK